MVSPQEGHTRIGVLSGTRGGHSMGGIEGIKYCMDRLHRNRRERYRTLSHRRAWYAATAVMKRT